MSSKYSSMSLKEAILLLRLWREDTDRQSLAVLQLWNNVVRDEVESLGDERWVVYEQVAIAGCDNNQMDVIDECLNALKNQFDLSSVRVRLLLSMKYEVLEEWKSALKILDLILEEDDTNTQAKKRKIAILKAQGEISKAISELNTYLKDYNCDQEAWNELCDLYILEQDFGKAAFCLEELLLHNPHNHLYYERYAEIKYTHGGFENLEIAKSYFSAALKLNPQNMRALYGLLLTANQLVSSPKTSTVKKREHLKSATWASKRIAFIYDEKVKGDNFLPALEGLMGQMVMSP